ncbi:MAG: dihydroneopterin triphosphate diphosphatase [Bacteroidota bacterium]
MSLSNKRFKRPESILVVVYTRTGKVLLLQRADAPDFWQSVTGSLRWDETQPLQAALRELGEETGLKAPEGLRDLRRTYRYPILPQWRHRYAPDVAENVEHAFALELPAEILITVNPAEHARHGWFAFDEAAGKVASWTNREVIMTLKTQG